MLSASTHCICSESGLEQLSTASSVLPLLRHRVATHCSMCSSLDSKERRHCGADVGVPAMQGGAALPIRAPNFPIRVIDVEKTVGSKHGSVVFSKPTSWEFHTISHTWSRDVQDWSKDIAIEMDRSTREGKAVTYNDLFQEKDSSKQKGYHSFMEFLKLLMADGVKQVWLDHLCINQGSETGEKTQELQNMGSYYARSLGCYVCARGFGKGFETWKVKKKKNELVMPRWFDRVWTFQEMLLPKTVTFILAIHPVIRRTINWSISKQAAQGVNGPCKCAMAMCRFPHPRDFFYEKLQEEFEDDEEEEGISYDSDQNRQNSVKQRGIGLMCGDLPCSQCGGSALIRRAKDLRLLQQLQAPATRTAPDLYFIDRKCIFRLLIMAKEQLERTLWTKVRDENAEWKLLRLETLMEQRDAAAAEEDVINLQGGGDHQLWDPIQVVVEVSRRDCTHDEDRILSILGLLGVEGAVALRADKTLDAQLLDLAQQLTHANPTTLVKLCIAQFAGHTRPGMSWAPSLVEGGLRPTGEKAPPATWQKFHRDEHIQVQVREANEHIYARQMQVEEASEPGLLELGRVMRHFERNVQVKNVLDNGCLLLSEARVLWDCCFVRVQDKNLFNLQLNCNHNGAELMTFQFKAYFSPSSCLLHRRVFVAGATTLANQSIVRLEGTELNVRLTYFQVCLVLLGQLHLPNDEKQEVMMVCVGNKFDCLHKVGLAWLPGLEDAFSHSAHPPSLCPIGGFSDYMDRFVF